MGDFSFGCIERNALYIDGVGRIKRNRQDVRSENILNTTHHIARGSDVRFRHRQRLSVVLNRLENVG